MSNSQRREATAKDIVSAPDNDFEGLVKTIGSVINPLAQQQATVQQRAIDADLEKFRISDATRERQSARGFLVTLGVLVLLAGVIGGFMWVGQYQHALYALTFVAGAVTGAGGVKAFERPRNQ